MAQAHEIASFRRLTPGILASARLAMADDVPEVSKAEVAVTLKKAAPVLGIDGSTYHVMDILIGLSRAEDWKGARRPIVAISNAKLAEYTGRSVRQVIRCIRRLVETGILAYRDSPTGRRFVYRDRDGEIDRGYGLDFTPARVRIKEFQGLVTEFQARLNQEQEARRTRTRLSRAIIDACGAYPEQAESWQERLHQAMTDNAGSLAQAAAIEEVHRGILRETAEVAELEEMSCEGDICVMPNTNTPPQDSIESKQNRPHSNEQKHPGDLDDRVAVAIPTEKKTEPASGALLRQNSSQLPKNVDEVQSAVLSSVSIGLIRSACAGACGIAGRALKTWPDLAASANNMRLAIGLSEAAWRDGVEKVGRYGAAAILTTVLEKSMRNPEQISSPGGYFRAMVERATDGRLYLDKSLFGLADDALGRERPGRA